MISAFELAVERTPVPELLTTARVFRALSDVDHTANLQRLWLLTGDPAGLGLDQIRDDVSTRDQRSWQGVQLSDDLARAMDQMQRLASAYTGGEISPGICALGLVLHPSAGAARALCGTRISHSDLLELVQENVIGEQLPELDTIFRHVAGPAAAPGAASLVEPAGKTPRSLDPFALIFTSAAERTRGRRACDEWDVLISAGRADDGALLGRLGLGPLALEQFEQDLRSRPSSSAQDLRARVDTFGTGMEIGRALVTAVAQTPSPAMSFLLQALGLEPDDLLFEAAFAGQPEKFDRNMWSRTMAVLATSVAIMAYVGAIAAAWIAITAGPWWALLLAPLTLATAPTVRFLPWLMVPALTLVLNPWLGGLQFIRCLAEARTLRLQRILMMSMTGVVLSANAARRRGMAMTDSGRSFALRRQRARGRIAGLRGSLAGS